MQDPRLRVSFFGLHFLASVLVFGQTTRETRPNSTSHSGIMPPSIFPARPAEDHKQHMVLNMQWWMTRPRYDPASCCNVFLKLGTACRPCSFTAGNDNNLEEWVRDSLSVHKLCLNPSRPQSSLADKIQVGVIDLTELKCWTDGGV